MSYFTKDYNEAGTAPGELNRDSSPAEEVQVNAVRYSADTYSTQESVSIHDALAQPRAEGEKLWLSIMGRPTPELVQAMERELKLHALALEDVLHAGQRSKVDDYEDHLFVVLQRPRWQDHKLAIGQISLFLGKDFVISIDDAGGDVFEPVRTRLETSPGGRIRSSGVDYLFYALVDLVIDKAFPVLEGYAEELEDLELKVISNPKQSNLLNRLHESRRELVFLRRALWSQRDTASALLREDIVLINPSTRLYLRDCADHAHHILDLADSYRDMSGAVMELLLSSQNKQLNEAMRVLTMIATIFIPLSFVVGVYGMNFDTSISPWNMPELEWRYGYPMILLMLFSIALSMVVYFKRKGWL